MASQARLTPRVDSQTFVGVLWGGTVVSLCFLIFRFFVRIKSFHKIYLDDYLVLAAWLMVLTASVLWQTHISAMYLNYSLANGVVLPTPEVMAALNTFYESSLAVDILLDSCLWSVKLSFLVFFRRLDDRVQRHRIWWRCVLCFTIATYLTCIGTVPYSCIARSAQYIFAHCGTPRFIKHTWAVLYYHCTIDIISDVMIISVPVLMFYKVRISLRQKLAIIMFSSLSVVIILFSIIRIAVVSSHAVQADITWLWMWTNIEMSIAVIMACLTSFRQLYIKSAQSSSDRQQSPLTSWRSLISSFAKSRSKLSVNSRGFGTSQRIPERPSQDSGVEHIIPLDKIYVNHEVNLSSSPLKVGMEMPQAGSKDMTYPEPVHHQKANTNRIWSR